MDIPRSPDDDARDLVRADGPFEVAGPEALGRLIEQSNREAAASRAQARELIKALEGVQRSQEYLGEALLAERRKSRGLLALLVLAPIVAAVGAWFVWRHVDALKSDVDGRIARLASDAAVKQRDGRVAELSSDVEALRRDLDSSREALASERSHVSDREAALAAAEHGTDVAKSEMAALNAEVTAARSRANAEQQRAIALEEKLDEAKSRLASRTPPPATVTSPPPTPAPTPSAFSPGPAAVDAVAGAAPPAANAPEVKPASVDPADVEKARTALNKLLGGAGDSVRYQFESIGSISGRSLVEVRAVGTDDRGIVVRTIVAARAEVTVDSKSSGVVLRFFDGRLVVGKAVAPFFDGAYGLVLRADPAAWKAAALAFVETK